MCTPQLSQWVALGALEAGRGWVEERVHGLESNRCLHATQRACSLTLECYIATVLCVVVALDSSSLAGIAI